MPELPEVETTRRDLEGRIVGRRIVAVTAPPAIAPPCTPLSLAEFAAAVQGRRIARLDRRGKYLIVSLSDGMFLILHRRMTGNLILACPDDPQPRFLRGAFLLDDGRELRWEDQRRFGSWTLTDDPERALAALGPEPLGDGWTPADLAAALRGRTAPIKAALLDQRRVAGLGNIYADESLHRAGIHPSRAAGSLTGAEVCRLHAAVRDVLLKAIRLQGSSMRNHRGGLGQKGTMQEEWQVFDRGGQPCYRCGTAIVKTRVAGRGTHLCPACQPPRPTEADEGALP